MENVPDQIYIVIGALLLLGLGVSLLGLRRLLSRKMMSGGANLVIGLLFLTCAVASVGILANLYTYKHLTSEQLIGSLSFERHSSQEYIATFTSHTGKKRQFSIYGDQCQLDARLLKWQGLGILLGLETLYRIERISGRYDDTELENSARRSAYTLSEQAGIELWEIVNQYNKWIPWIDAVYGNAVYVPMQNNAQYQITITISGLIARPLNPAAKQAIKDWK